MLVARPNPKRVKGIRVAPESGLPLDENSGFDEKMTRLVLGIFGLGAHPDPRPIFEHTDPRIKTEVPWLSLPQVKVRPTVSSESAGDRS